MLDWLCIPPPSLKPLSRPELPLPLVGPRIRAGLFRMPIC